MLESFTCATFEQHLGETFRVGAGDREGVDLMLTEVTALSSSSPDRAREPFSIVFRGPPDPVMPQQIQRLQHPGLGTFELFLVPIGPDGEGMQYEAVFT